MIHLAGPYNSGAAVGSAGVATANQDSSVILTGRVLGVYVKYNDSPPAGTTDVVIATVGSRHPATTVLSLANGATDGWRYPNLQVTDVSGVAITGEYQGILIADKINVKIDQANAADSVDVWLLLGEI